MVGPVVALIHLDRLRPQRQGQHLVTEADAEQGRAAVDQFANLRHRIDARRRRIARPVGQDHAIRLARQNGLSCRVGGHHGDLRAGRGQRPQDVALHAIVDNDHRLVGRIHPRMAFRPVPEALVPVERLQGRGVLRQIKTDQTSPGASLRDQGLKVELARRVMGDHGVGGAHVADAGGQGARVHAGETDHAAPLHPVVEIALAAPVGRIGRGVAEDRAARRGVRAAADLLDVLDIGPGVADVREGEGQDLAHIGRVGQDLLIPGHGGVEDHLAERRTDGAAADALQDGAVREREHAGDAGKEFGGHGALSITESRRANGAFASEPPPPGQPGSRACPA